MTTLPQTTGVRFSAPRPLAATGGGMGISGTHLGHAGGASAAAQAGMSAGDVWRAPRATGWLIAAALVIPATLGVGPNFLLKKYYKRYPPPGMLQTPDQRPNAPLDKPRQYSE